MHYRLGVALVLAASALGGVTFTHGSASTASAAVVQKGHNHCGPGAYKHGRCTQLTKVGDFSIKVPSVGISLSGTTTASNVGAQVTVSKATVASAPKGAKTFRVSATGGFPAMKPQGKGTLYEYNPKSDAWTKVSAVTEGGIYAWVPSKSK